MAITSRCGRDNPGSIPGWDIFLASLAQLVEHTPLKRRVVGSNPTGDILFFYNRFFILMWGVDICGGVETLIYKIDFQLFLRY